MDKILRVATFNNVNFSDKEMEELDVVQALCPEYKIFVNANSYNEIRGKFPCVVTVNPNLDTFVEPRGDLTLIKAIRIKYVANPTPVVKEAFETAMKWGKQKGIPILITYMRFKSTKTLSMYTMGKGEFYTWKRNFFRQNVKQTFDNVHYCDLKDKGCPSCKNCAKLTYGIDTDEIYSINLSASGVCKYNCVDCYAKIMGKFCTFSYDKILQNSKQKGHMVN